MKTTKVIALFALAVGLCTVLASRTDAQCGVSLNHNRVTFPASFAAMAERPAQEVGGPQTGDDPTIVGLWDVKFISEGQVVDEGFDQYHSDGTEILNDTPPPATGNVCLGVFARTGARSIKLRHPSWIFDPTNTFVIGRATILEQITVERNGKSYKGTFTIQFRDMSGNPLAPDFSGQIKSRTHLTGLICNPEKENSQRRNEEHGRRDACGPS